MSSLLTGQNLPHTLAAAILFSRLGDIGSTYLATPNLKLEANPIMRRAGWPFAWLSTLACLVAYYDVGSGIMVLVSSLLITSSNLSKAWRMRALGEVGYQEHMLRVVKRSSIPEALGFNLGSAAFAASVGGVILPFAGPRSVSFWVALGIVLYGAVVGLYGSLSILRLFKRVGADGVQPGDLMLAGDSPNEGTEQNAAR